jgi:hypothetical protein
MLFYTNNAPGILEGILVRWVMHRVSGQSDLVDSLLPLEFIEIPKNNGWHMEKDAREVAPPQRPGEVSQPSMKLFFTDSDKSRIRASPFSMASPHELPRR